MGSTLERISLDHGRLASLAAWWQSWKQKKALEQELRTKDAENPDIHEAAGLFTVAFPTYRVRFHFDRLSDKQDKVTAELTVRLCGTELLGETDIGLKSESSRSKIANTLKRMAAEIPWVRLLERACTGVLKRHRLGEPPLSSIGT
jgi:hypothetical protein